MSQSTNFLDLVAERLTGDQFRLSHNPGLPNGESANLAASREYFSRPGFSYISQHLLITVKEHATAIDLQKLFEAGFLYAKSANRMPLLRGMLFGYMVIPCIAARFVHDDAIEYVSTLPKKRFALFEFPAVHDLGSGQTYYYRSGAVWGGLFFAEMQAAVRRYIEGNGRA